MSTNELPPFPKHHGFFENDQMIAGYTALQMRDYAIAAIRASQSQQPATAEPTMWATADKTKVRTPAQRAKMDPIYAALFSVPLYAAAAAVQPPVEPLTEEQIVEIRDDHLPNQGEPFDCIAFARAIEAALRVRGIGSVPPSDLALDSNADSGHQAERVTGGVRTEPGASS